MKKILIVMLSLYNGGAEKSLVNMLNELPEDKYDVDLLLFKREGMFLKQVPQWVNIIDTPDTLKKLYGPLSKSGNMFFIKLIGTLVSKIKGSNPQLAVGYRWENYYTKKIDNLDKEYDVAIAYTSNEVMFFVGDKVKAHRKITWIHNDFRGAKHPKKYDYKYFKEFELVTISEECARIVEEEFTDLNKHVHNIANITSSAVIRSRAEEFIPAEFDRNNFNILSIGRLAEQKGFDYAIEAAFILKSAGVKFRWYIIGDGDLHDKLQTMIDEKNLNDYFHLLGVRDNPYPYIKNCDLFAQTSRYEGKSVVIDEAKILAKPIIVTNYSTVKDQIEDMVEGVVVDISSSAIAEGIEELITNEELRTKLIEYLESKDYGNQDEINKYMELIDKE